MANFGENETLSDENQAIMLLNSLPDSSKEVKTIIKYERTSITLDEVVSALRLRDLELKAEKSYFARGKSQQRGYNNNVKG